MGWFPTASGRIVDYATSKLPHTVPLTFKGVFMDIKDTIEKARLAQQGWEAKHDVQLELPVQWLVLDCEFNRMWYPYLVNQIVLTPPAYAPVHRIG